MATAPFGITQKYKHLAKKIVPTILESANHSLAGNQEMDLAQEEISQFEKLNESQLSEMSSIDPNDRLLTKTPDDGTGLSQVIGSKRRKE